MLVERGEKTQMKAWIGLMSLRPEQGLFKGGSMVGQERVKFGHLRGAGLADGQWVSSRVGR